MGVAEPRPHPAVLNATLSQRIDLAPGLAIMRVAPRGWTLGGFAPGQYAVLGLPAAAPRVAGSRPEPAPADPGRLLRRAYSIASSSRVGEYVELYLNLVPGGVLTPRLFALAAGDGLWLSPRIVGTFTLDRVPPDRNLALFATGTGLAPYMSMLRTLLPDLGDRRLAVIHGARHASDLAYRDELEAVARLADRVTYVPILSRPQEDALPWRGLVGHVQDVWRSGLLGERWGAAPTPADTHVLLCGNPAMLDDKRDQLTPVGFVEHTNRQPGQIHLERYW
ncbi:MAG TPA: ferredoxin--NADP reductase [Polyangia bacterium]